MATYGTQIVVDNDNKNVLVRDNLYAVSVNMPVSMAKAKGDGLTDDTDAILEAMNEVNALGGGVVQLGEGTYLISSSLVVPGPNIILKGKGYNTQIKVADGMDADAIDCRYDRCGFQDFFLNGNKANQASGKGFIFYNAYRPFMYRVFIQDVKEHGVYAHGDISPKTSVLTIDTCVIENVDGNSIQIDPYAQDTVIVNSFTQDAGGFGCYLNNCFGTVITNTHFFRNVDTNLQISGGARHRLENLTLDRSDNWGCVLNGNTKDIVMSKCILFDNNQGGGGAGGLAIETGTETCIIQGNVFYDEQGVPTQDTGISVKNGAINNVIRNNIVKQSVVNDYGLQNQAIQDNIIEDTRTLLGNVLQSYSQKEIPLNGQTIGFNNNTANLLLRPAAPLATLTINLPQFPKEGQKVTIVSTENITTLTLNPTGPYSIVGGTPTALSAGIAETFIFDLQNGLWFSL